jgi:DNA-binding IclR family transcriptional regulator
MNPGENFTGLVVPPRPNHPQVRGAESPRRVLQVLLAFSEQRPFASISELAEEVGVPLSTCYRYVGLLREMGLIDEGDRGRYYVTSQIMHVARAAQVASPLRKLAEPILTRIESQINETVMLMQRFHSIVLCVESAISSRSFKLVFEPGYAFTLGTAASGKLLLAVMPKSEREAFIAERAASDPKFAQLRAQLEEDLPRYAEQGWASSSGEIETGVWAVATLIRNGAAPVATLSVAGPAFRIDEQEQARILGLLVDGAAEISQALSILH